MQRNGPGFAIVAAIVGLLVGWVAASLFRGKGAESHPAAIPTPGAAADATPSSDMEPYEATLSIFNILVVVGPTAKDLTPKNPIAVQYDKAKPFTWRTLEQSGTLRILFPEKKFKPLGAPHPFAAMTRRPVSPGSNEMEWFFTYPWSANTEMSGALNPDIAKYFDEHKDVTQLTYDYDQVLNGQREDGRMIIHR